MKYSIVLRVLAALLMTLAVEARADSVASKVKQGNLRYDQKMYDQALQLYNEALLEEPNRREVVYNLANTFYRQGKYKEAATELKKVTDASESAMRARAHYNLGNAFFKENQFQEAADQYTRVLQLDPKDRDAKYNLELALKKLEEQKQQSQSSKKDQKQDSNNEENKQDSGQQRSGQEKNQDSQQQQGQQPQQQDTRSKDQQQSPQKDDAPRTQDSGTKPLQPKGLSRQDAERILQAMDAKEREELMRQLQKVRRQVTRGRDW